MFIAKTEDEGETKGQGQVEAVGQSWQDFSTDYMIELQVFVFDQVLMGPNP